METIKLREAAQRVGVPYSTCARWVQHGLVRLPVYKRTQAVKVKLDPKAMRDLRALSQLRALLSLQELNKAMRCLRQHLGQNPSSSSCIVVIGGPPKKRRLIKLYGSEQRVELSGGKRGQFLMRLFFDSEDSKEIRKH